jgi:hypothetical protein
MPIINKGDVPEKVFFKFSESFKFVGPECNPYPPLAALPASLTLEAFPKVFDGLGDFVADFSGSFCVCSTFCRSLFGEGDSSGSGFFTGSIAEVEVI